MDPNGTQEIDRFRWRSTDNIEIMEKDLDGFIEASRKFIDFISGAIDGREDTEPSRRIDLDPLIKFKEAVGMSMQGYSSLWMGILSNCVQLPSPPSATI
jgi:hypothetical protein